MRSSLYYFGDATVKVSGNFSGAVIIRVMVDVLLVVDLPNWVHKSVVGWSVFFLCV